jgi:hypothetical protein
VRLAQQGWPDLLWMLRFVGVRQGCGGDALDDRVLYLHGGVYIYYAPGELGLRPSSGGSWPASRARPSSRAAGPHAIAGLKRWC